MMSASAVRCVLCGEVQRGVPIVADWPGGCDQEDQPGGCERGECICPVCHAAATSATAALPAASRPLEPSTNVATVLSAQNNTLAGLNPVQGVNVTALREIKLLRELRSPNVVQLLDVFAHKRKNLQLVKAPVARCASSMKKLDLQTLCPIAHGAAAILNQRCFDNWRCTQQQTADPKPVVQDDLRCRRRCSSIARRTWSWS